MNSLTEAVVTILTAIVGVAILAVLVGQKSQTSSVIQAAGSAFGNSLAVAESPVTGTSVTPTLSYPNAGLGGLPAFG
jgi:PRD1 phage membrane DNA delivery